MFQSNGKHLRSHSLPPECSNDFTQAIATDRDGNLYLLSGRPLVYVFDKHGNLQHRFNLTFSVDDPVSIAVNKSSKVPQVLRRGRVDMYNTTNGRAIGSFGYEKLKRYAHTITTANDGNVMVLAYDD